MATRYLKSTTGSDANNGTTWALAKATLAGIDAIDTAGDLIAVSQAHAESTAGVLNWALAGSNASPTKLVCGNDGASPPTAVAATGTISTSGGATSITINGQLYVYGLSFIGGVGGSTGGSITCGTSSGSNQSYENCSFQIASSSPSAAIGVGSATNGVVRWRNCTIKFGATGQEMNMTANASFFWNGGSVLSGGSSPSNVLMDFVSAVARVEIENVDLSNLGSTVKFTQNVRNAGKYVMRNCKLPASWTGTLTNGTLGGGGRASMYNCDSGNTNYKVWIEDFAGAIREEIVDVRTGGASDGTTPFAWRMTTNTNAVFPLHNLATDEIVIWNDTAGSAKTLTVEILSSTATILKNNEAWLEVNYLTDSGDPLGTIATSAPDILTTGTNNTTSSATWTTTGLTSPAKMSLAITVTPQQKGWFICRVMMAKASAVMIVDPVITVS